AELLQPELQDRIEIGEDDETCARLLTDLLCRGDNATQVGSVPQSSFAGPLDHWPVGDWIAEGHTQLNHLSSGLNGRERDLARSIEVRIAAGEVGHQAGPPIENNRQLASFPDSSISGP